MAVLGSFAPYFFQNIIQNRNGAILSDFILDQFNPHDWSWEIMGLLYSALLVSIVANYNKPRIVLLGLCTYCVVTWLRIACIYFVVLDPPRGVIPLTDPLLSIVVYNKLDFVKDLFFSGHISTMSVLIFSESRRKVRWLISAMTLVMGILLLAQHVHYTIDVLFAPPITYLVSVLIRKSLFKMPRPD